MSKIEMNNIHYHPKFQQWLKSMLRDGEVLIKFTKKDGSDRTMRCTLSSDIIPEQPVSESKKEKKENTDVLPVFDIEANGWRSFRWDSINSVSITLSKEDA